MYKSFTEDESLKDEIAAACKFEKPCKACVYCAWCRLEEVFDHYPNVIERIENGKAFIEKAFRLGKVIEKRGPGK